MAPMYRLDEDHYLNTPSGLLTRYRRRAARRMDFRIEGIEPRAKQSMSSGDKDQVQQQVLDWLERHRRAALRGPLALRLRLQTTDKAPTHAHNIAKNLLDLFGRPRPTAQTGRHALLYADDQQVHALSVSCRHGDNTPSISVMATSLGDTLAEV
jgi:hypothetical protein